MSTEEHRKYSLYMSDQNLIWKKFSYKSKNNFSITALILTSIWSILFPDPIELLSL